MSDDEIAYVVLFTSLTLVAGTREEFNVGFWGELMNQRILPYLNLYELKKFTSCNRLVQGVCDSYLEDHDPFITMVSPFMDVGMPRRFASCYGTRGGRFGSLCVGILSIFIRFEALNWIFTPPLTCTSTFGALASFRSPADYPGKGRHGSLTSAVVDVFRLLSLQSGKSVRISAFRFSFMHVVLELHSTIAMCFVDAFRAVCIYPRLSFLHHVNIPSGAISEDAIHARVLFAIGDWPLLDTELATLGTDAHLGQIRVVGDRFCWIHPHAGVEEDETVALLPHSWSMRASVADFSFSMQFECRSQGYDGRFVLYGREFVDVDSLCADRNVRDECQMSGARELCLER
ncbi:hypothetical protein BDZ89DRAFT_1139508 [Hymenopellis radicata]|nr:hypothetical protein BDZ89DRAFT_1139508 [Hymenopellis radicata]